MKSLQHLYAVLLAVFAVLAMPCASLADEAKNPLAAPAGGSKDTHAAPVKGREYAKQRAVAFATAFNELSNCIIDKMPGEGEDWEGSAWIPDMMYLCEPKLAAFETTRIDLGLAPNLQWDNSQEEKSITEQAALIDSFHQPIVRIFNFLIRGLAKDSSARKAMTAHYLLLKWYDQKGENYKKSLTEMDKLLTEYYTQRQKGRMVDGHFECSSSTMRAMESTVKKLANYFDYNVDSTQLRGMSKGVFLYDLDAHSTSLAKNIKNSVNYVRIAQSTAENFFKQFKAAGPEKLEKMDKNAMLYGMASSIPWAVGNLERRVMKGLDVTLAGMNALADGSSPAGKFLMQKDLGEYSHFAVSSDGSFIRSIRKSCAQILLNTTDAKGRQIKHSTRGGKFPVIE